MDIKNNIKKIEAYIKEKVIKGEYEVVGVEDVLISIRIQDYTYKLWMNPQHLWNVNFFYTDQNGQATPKPILKESESSDVLKHLKPKVDTYKSTFLKEQNEKIIKKLQEQNQSLCKI